MPKKANSKAVAANEHKKAVKGIKDAMAAADAEDASWTDDRKAKKHELKKAGAEDASAMRTARRAQDKLLVQEEEQAMATPKAKGGKKNAGGSPKMTAAMMAQAREMREQQELKAANRAAAKTVDADEYARLVDGPNRNGEGVEAATGIDDILGGLDGDKARIQAMAAASGSGQRAANKAAAGVMTYKVFESSRLAELKADKPGLKASQYRDMAKKEWGRSPANPANQ